MRAAGFVFEVRAANVDEARHGGEAPADYVRRLAEAKARTVAGKIAASNPVTGGPHENVASGGLGDGKMPAGTPALLSETTVIIGADTVVVLEGEILGKPADDAAARAMLTRLSGRSHEVHSGMALLRLPDGALRLLEEVTLVDFSVITPSEIDDYVATGEPSGKAGAYAIQGIGGRFVRRLGGSYFNVMGLPISRLYEELRVMGLDEDSTTVHVKDTYTLWNERTR